MMPVSELDIANSLYWLLGYGPSDERGRLLSERLNLRFLRDQAALRTALMGSEEFGHYAAERRQAPHIPALDLDRPRLILLHLPKCGGTTLLTILARHFDPGSICPERFNGLRAYRLADLAAFDLFSGHFDLESCQALYGRNTQTITMLREPRARLVSLYYFLKIHRPEDVPATATMVSLARSLAAEDFFQHPLIRRHASVLNGLVSPFLRAKASFRWEAIEDQLDAADLVVTDPVEAGERAFQALASLMGFGLLEDFSGSLELLGATLGLRLDNTMPPQQVTDEMRTREHLSYAERPALNPALIAILDELTQADRVLYQKAQALFEERLARARGNAVRLDREAPARRYKAPQAIPLDRFHPLEARRDGNRIVASGVAGVVAAGPYMALRHGHYRLTCHFLREPAADGDPGFALNVWYNRGQGLCEEIRWTDRSPSVLDFALAFDVSNIEFVIKVGPDSQFEMLAMELAEAVDREAEPPAS